MARLRLITTSFPDDPAFDTAVSQALLLRASEGELPDTLRIARPAPMVAFGKRDVVSPGYAQAVEAARAEGFEGVERLAGGRAAVFHEHTLSIAHAVADEDPRTGVTRRFLDAAALTVRALARLGVDARMGEVPGEYCPGQHSVNAGGQRKLMGIGQRLIRHGAHVGMVVVVDGEERISQVLTPVYAALDLDWLPQVTGSIASEAPGATWESAAAAFEAEYSARYDLEAGELDEQTLELARELEESHRSPSASTTSTV